MPNLCDASATKAGKGRAERTVTERGIGADPARAEPASGGAEHTKMNATHIARRNEDERAGCVRPLRADTPHRWAGREGEATLWAPAPQVSGAETV